MIRIRLILAVLMMTVSRGAIAQVPTLPRGGSAESQPTDGAEAPVTVISLKHADAADVARILEQLYRPQIRAISTDQRTNSLLVRCDDARIKDIENLLQVLDAPPARAAVETKSATEPQGGTPLPGPLGLNVYVPAAGVAAPVDVAMQPGGGEQTFSFYMGLSRGSVNDLRQRQKDLENQSHDLAAQLRRPLADPGVGKALRAQLNDTVRQAFEARQELQRAELAVFDRRLRELQRSIETRDRIAEQIIERRVEELLDPHLEWEAPAASSAGDRPEASGASALIAPTPGAEAVLLSAPQSVTDGVLARSPEALLDLLAKRANQVRQIQESIRGWESERPKVRDTKEVDGALRDLQGQLEEHRKKQSQAEQEYLHQVKLLEAVLELERSRLEVAEEAVRSADDMLAKGAISLQVHRERFLRQQEARVAVQRAESLLELFRQAGEGYVSPPGAPPTVDAGAGLDPQPQDGNAQIHVVNRKFKGIERINGPGGAISEGRETRFNVPFGSRGKYRLTGIAGHADASVSVTLNLSDAYPRMVDAVRHNAIPLQIADEDYALALSGARVIKVVYLADEPGVAGKSAFSTISNTTLETGVDPRRAAELRGPIVAVVEISTDGGQPDTGRRSPQVGASGAIAFGITVDYLAAREKAILWQSFL